MKMSVLAMIALSLAFAGCSKQERAQRSPEEQGGGKTGTASKASSIEEAMDADEILISVNGSELTRGEAYRQVQLRLGGPPPSDLPPERVTAIRNQTLSKVIDEFVKRELLLREADRLGIEAAGDEIDKTIEGIRAKSAAGGDPQGILQTGPAGKDTLRNEVVTGIRIEKLLAIELPPTADPSDEEIEAFVAENRGKLMMPERVRARHILVEVAADAPAETRAQKREMAEALRAQLLEGADFAELAASESSCPSAARGGDLGVFPRGKMVKAFEDAAFGQKEGEIGEVVETPFGFHVIRVENHFQAGMADREQIVAIIRQRARALALADYVRKLQSVAEIKHSPYVRPPAPLPAK